MLVTPFDEGRHLATRRMAIDGYLEISIGGNRATFVTESYVAKQPSKPARDDSAGNNGAWRPAPLLPGRLPATLLDAGIYSS
jgi:hypothetical protein